MPNSSDTPDLESLSASELKALQRQVDQALSKSETRRKRDAVAAVERAINEFGLTLEEVLSAASTTKSERSPNRKAASDAKFRNPENAQETWSGRGRRPAWFKAHLEACKSEDELRV